MLTINDSNIATFAGGNGRIVTNVLRCNYFNSANDSFTIFQTNGATGNAKFYQGVSIGTSSDPSTSAQLEIVSTTKGFLPPRTNLTSSISSPAQGLITYLTGSTNEGLYYYNSGSIPGWRQVADTTFVSASLSGSAGYLPVFTGANSVSSSVIFQTGSRVGIGTTTPSHTVQVVGTTRLANLLVGSSGNTAINNTNNDTSINLNGGVGIAGGSLLTPTARLHVRGAGATSSTTALRVENTNASASLVVLDNGNVGLGTNTPISLLQIGNGSGFLGDFTTPAITFDNINNGIYLDTNRISFKSGGGFSFSTDSNGILGNGFRINSALFNDLTTPIFVPTRIGSGPASGYGGNDAGHLSLITNNTPRLYVDFSGSVGIDTISPSASLHISGASSAALLRVESPASASILFVSGSGRVNINTTASRFDLTLKNEGRIGSDFITDSFISLGNAIGLQANYNVYTLKNLAVGAGDVAARLGVRGSGTTSATTALLVENSNTSASLAVLDNSNVGIGTTTAAYRLSVLAPNAGDGIAAYVGSSAMIMTGNAGFGNPGIGSTSGVIHVNATLNGTGGSEVLNVNKSSNGAYIQAWRSQASATLSLVDGNGNFAIRRTSATASLDVK